MRFGHVPEQPLALDLAVSVVVQQPDVLPQPGRLFNRGGLVGRVTVCTRRADVHEPFDTGPRRRLGECPRGLESADLKFFPGTPVADLGRAVEDQRKSPIARSQATGSVKSPRSIATPRPSRNPVSLVGRTKVLTRYPWVVNFSARWLPKSPVAPVTSTPQPEPSELEVIGFPLPGERADETVSTKEIASCFSPGQATPAGW